MYDLRWSAAEKKVARSAYDRAVETALSQVMAEVKARAAAAAAPSDMWAVEDYLREQRRNLDDMFDYRYSQLPLVFARLIRHGYLDEARLRGLSQDKLAMIRGFLSL